MIATHMIWRAAGYPSHPHAETAPGACYWCAAPLDGLIAGLSQGVPVSAMPDTFLDACGREAGSPSSTHLCPACAWTLSDAVVLPRKVGAPLLARALSGDGNHPGRLSVAVGDEPPTRRLVMPCRSGVGVWERPGKPADESAWVDAHHRLRTEPATVGSARFVGIYGEAHLVGRVGGKFRNFIPFATASGRWEMWTKANRAEIRSVLVSPPTEPWTLAIGDGQKHAAIYARVSDGRVRGQVVRFEDATVHYDPEALRRVVEAVDALLAAGCRREHVEIGRYPMLGTSPTVRAMEARVRPFRGGPVFLLAMWLATKNEQ